MFNWFRKRPSFKYEILALICTIVIAYVYFFIISDLNAYAFQGHEKIYLFLAAIFGLYMAINIGSNDVANNMGPAVGSKAITITGAIIIAAIFEASGVMLAGGDVINTIKKGIIDPALITNSMDFIAIMMATLAGAALWVNIATYFKAPVSTTHSVVGGLIGAGVFAVGPSIVDWYQVGQIAISWLISPIMGGVIAVILMQSIRHNILKKDDRGESAKVWVPIYIGIMVWAFTTYLLLKGFKQVLKGSELGFLLENEIAMFLGYLLAVGTFVALRVHYKQQSSYFKNSKKFINRLFNIPLIFAVALLSFAHGANDVANAIGPLAAINDAIKNHGISGSSVGIDVWIMLIGAIGLAAGLSVFGARLIKTVGTEITKLNQIRAYCVALSAALTVIFASQLGLPVSSTHIALGGVFGIGIMREYIKRKKGNEKAYIEKGMIRHIVLAWVITLPVSGLISGVVYSVIINFS